MRDLSSLCSDPVKYRSLRLDQTTSPVVHARATRNFSTILPDVCLGAKQLCLMRVMKGQELHKYHAESDGIFGRNMLIASALNDEVGLEVGVLIQVDTGQQTSPKDSLCDCSFWPNSYLVIPTTSRYGGKMMCTRTSGLALQ